MDSPLGTNDEQGDADMTNAWNDEHEWTTDALEGWAAETHNARANAYEAITHHRGNEWREDIPGMLTDRDWITFDGTGETSRQDYNATVNRDADIPGEGFGSGPAISVDLWDGDGQHIVCVDVETPEPDRKISTDQWAEWVAQHVAEYLPKGAA